MIPHSKGIPGMPPKKILFLTIAISLASHVAMLSLAALINMQGEIPREEVLTVQLKESPEKIAQKTEAQQKPHPVAKPVQKNAVLSKKILEDTVDLGDADSKYTAYLKKIKQKIETVWTYPRNAYKREEEGVSVIKFSINTRGELVASGIISSSGSLFLDQGTMNVVKYAAPYAPLPPEFNLAQLNVIARFQYKLAE
jgi:TonB family protein